MLFVLTAMLWAGCKKEDNNDNENGNPEVLVADKTDYKFYEIVTVRFLNESNGNDLIDATVNGKPAKVAIADDSNLVFAISPGIYEAGSNVLKFEHDGKSHSVSFHVGGSVPVVTPATVLAEMKTMQLAQLAQLDAIMAADTSGALLLGGMATKLQQARDAINAPDPQWDQLTPEDKQVLGAFLDANKGRFQKISAEITDFTNYIVNGAHGLNKGTSEFCTSGSNGERYKCMSATILRQIRGLLLDAAIVVAAAQTIALPYLGWVGVSLAAHRICVHMIPAGAALAANMYIFGRINWLIACLIVKDESYCFPKKGTTIYEFPKNTASPLPIKFDTENIRPGHVNAGLDWMNGIISGISAYNAFCDRFSSVLGDYKISYAPETTKRKALDQLSNISVQVTNNNLVTVSGISGTAAAPKIEFKTNATTDQNFAFEVKYNDGVVPELKVTLQAKLKVSNNDSLPLYKALIPGNWTANFAYQATGQQIGLYKFSVLADGSGHRDEIVYPTNTVPCYMGGAATCNDTYHEYEFYLTGTDGNYEMHFVNNFAHIASAKVGYPNLSFTYISGSGASAQIVTVTKL